MPKTLQWLPISARTKSKLVLHSDPILTHLPLFPIFFSAFVQPFTHTDLLPSTGLCMLYSLQQVLPGCCQSFMPPFKYQHPQEAFFELHVNLLYVLHRTGQGSTLPVLSVYMLKYLSPSYKNVSSSKAGTLFYPSVYSQLPKLCLCITEVQSTVSYRLTDWLSPRFYAGHIDPKILNNALFLAANKNCKTHSSLEDFYIPWITLYYF